MGNFTKAHSKWWEDNAKETEKNDSKRKKAIMQGHSATPEQRQLITKDTAGEGVFDKNGNRHMIPGNSDFDVAQQQGWDKKKIPAQKKNPQKKQPNKRSNVITIPQ